MFTNRDNSLGHVPQHLVEDRLVVPTEMRAVSLEFGGGLLD